MKEKKDVLYLGPSRKKRKVIKKKNTNTSHDSEFETTWNNCRSFPSSPLPPPASPSTTINVHQWERHSGGGHTQ